MLNTVKKSLPYLVLSLAIPTIVFASGSGMPYEPLLDKILSSITGTWLRFGCVCAIVFAGLGFAFGESGGFGKKMLGIVLGLSIACAATSWGLSFFGFSGGACF